MKKLHLIKLLLLTSIFLVQSQCAPKNNVKENFPFEVDPSQSEVDSGKVNGGTSPHHVPDPKLLDSLKQEAKRKRKG